MYGDRYATFPRLARAALATGLALALMPAVPAAAATDEERPGWLPRCDESGHVGIGQGTLAEPWRAVLDDDGVVVEHRLTLRRGGVEATLRTGPRAFAVPVGDDRLLLGERSDSGTRLAMIDIRGTCRLWTRQLERLVYPDAEPDERGRLRLALHEPATRLFEGASLLDLESGESGGLIDGVCITECEPNDGDVTPAAYLPPGPPRPVPSFGGGGWPKDKTLRYRWQAGEVPPTWAKDPLKAAAEDAHRTAAARSPRFVYDTGAPDSVRYTSAFPTYCRTGIACAARTMPSFWAVWLRPHATDFSWGTLRWCQKESASGCFDIRRVMIHELGHIAGLNHPSSNGSPLEAHETVMHAITPAKPKAGSGRHAFGRCDVATLQELYDVPDNKTSISTCNSVATQLDLWTGAAKVRPGTPVTVTAELRVRQDGAFGQLAGNPLNGRAVKLKFRRAGSGDAWQIAWMTSLYATGRYQATIWPSATSEFKAVFESPADEGLGRSVSAVVKVKVR